MQLLWWNSLGTVKNVTYLHLQPDILDHDWEANNSGDEGMLPDGLGKLAVSSSSDGRGQSLANVGLRAKKSTPSAPIRRPNVKRK